jgi:hypothetical protein
MLELPSLSPQEDTQVPQSCVAADDAKYQENSPIRYVNRNATLQYESSIIDDQDLLYHNSFWTQRPALPRSSDDTVSRYDHDVVPGEEGDFHEILSLPAEHRDSDESISRETWAALDRVTYAWHVFAIGPVLEWRFSRPDIMAKDVIRDKSESLSSHLYDTCLEVATDATTVHLLLPWSPLDRLYQVR